MTAGERNAILETLRSFVRGRRIVVFGVGNVLRGDDGFGPELVRRLQAAAPGLPAVDGGTVPENHLPPVLRWKPQRILVADCTDFGGKPGELRLFSRDEVESLPFLTHGFPLSLILEELERRSAAEVRVLAVQGQQLGMGAPLSPAVAEALEAVVETLADAVRCDAE
ncbi:MAG: hydrogenase 3 maturation endopeptidase HyCI [Acidobacteriota bacterium]